MRHIAISLAAGAAMMALPLSASAAVRIKVSSRFVQPIEALQLGVSTSSRSVDTFTSAGSDTLTRSRGLMRLEALSHSNVLLAPISPTISISGQSYSGFLVDKFTPIGISRIAPERGTRVASKGQLRDLGITSAALGPAPEQVGSVPEPATWAMLVMGFAAVGGAMRRKRRSSGVQRASAA